MLERVVFRVGDPLYRQSVALRYRVLREPLGLQFTENELLKDHPDLHYGLLHHNELMACLTLSEGDQGLKMRQVAVRPDVQHQGWGRMLCLWAEEQAIGRGYDRIFCHARQAVVLFYHRLGYVEKGPVFEEVGIPHLFMEKNGLNADKSQQ